MKVSAYLLLALCTLAVPALAADGPTPALAAGAEPLTTPAVGSCGAPSGDVLFAASGSKSGGGSSLVQCTADCGPYAPVSCSTTGSCFAVDRNCPVQRGYVQCDGQAIKECPVCPAEPECEEGTFKFELGDCCDCSFGGRERSRFKCIGGEWVFQDTFCGPGAGCPICP